MVDMKLQKKPVPGFEDKYYLDPDTMQVVNLKTGRPLKPYRDGAGYADVQLWRHNKGTHKNVHRLFAEAYIPNPEGLPNINHKDENPMNYSLDNLEWCTQSYNQNYGTVNERRGPKISAAKKGVSQPWVSENKRVQIIATDPDGNETYYRGEIDAAEDLNLRIKSVRDVVYGKRRTLYGYRFRRAE